METSNPLKIGIYGYGKMGKAVEQVALAHGDILVWKVTSTTSSSLTDDMIRQADVVIEFSQPDAAMSNITRCLHAGVRVISGTTGWDHQKPRFHQLTMEKQLAFLQASNFSIGVNLFFALNAYLARLITPHPDYRVRLEETHHIQKKDAPSGTAITLADRIISASEGRYDSWHLSPAEGDRETSVPILAHRVDDVPGTHTVTWSSAIDDLVLTHQAKSRDGFARGAWLAAHWIRDKHGLFTMADVLDLDRTAD